MKITLTNKTNYRDDDLRAIVRAACGAAGVAAKEVRLTVVRARAPRTSGWATLPRNGRSSLIWGTMRLRVPKEAQITCVAQVALHEAMHLAGVDHRDMTEEQLHCSMPVPWAERLELRPKEAPAPEQVAEHRAALHSNRLEHAQRMLAKAQTRVKRAQTIEKKWKRRAAALARAVATSTLEPA